MHQDSGAWHKLFFFGDTSSFLWRCRQDMNTGISHLDSLCECVVSGDHRVDVHDELRVVDDLGQTLGFDLQTGHCGLLAQYCHLQGLQQTNTSHETMVTSF